MDKNGDLRQNITIYVLEHGEQLKNNYLISPEGSLAPLVYIRHPLA